MNDLSSHVDVEYKAWANREQVIGQHIQTLWDAQVALSEVVSAFRFGSNKRSDDKIGTAWAQFFKCGSKLFQQAKPKIIKMKGLYDKLKEDGTQKKKTKLQINYDEMLNAVTRASNHMFIPESEDLTMIEYRDTIELISLLYDVMGYTEAERKVTRTGFLSDIQIPNDETEGEEMMGME